MKRRFFWLATGLVIAGLVWWLVPGYFETPLDPRSVEHLKSMAAEINRGVPVMIDAETELLSVDAAPATLTYNYRLVKYSAAQLDHEKFAAGVKQRVTQGACNRPETRDNFLKRGVTLRYAYFDKDRRPIATVGVTPADCGF